MGDNAPKTTTETNPDGDTRTTTVDSEGNKTQETRDKEGNLKQMKVFGANGGVITIMIKDGKAKAF